MFKCFGFLQSLTACSSYLNRVIKYCAVTDSSSSTKTQQCAHDAAINRTTTDLMNFAGKALRKIATIKLFCARESIRHDTRARFTDSLFFRAQMRFPESNGSSKPKYPENALNSFL